VAVDDVSLTIDEGEIFGILGPNGAGKTTTVGCIEGLRTPESGRTSVFGLGRRARAGHAGRRSTSRLAHRAAGRGTVPTPPRGACPRVKP
jgi:ABC-type multidrug transport system ATPase subunit